MFGRTHTIVHHVQKDAFHEKSHILILKQSEYLRHVKCQVYKYLLPNWFTERCLKKGQNNGDCENFNIHWIADLQFFFGNYHVYSVKYLVAIFVAIIHQYVLYREQTSKLYVVDYKHPFLTNMILDTWYSRWVRY